MEGVLLDPGDRVSAQPVRLYWKENDLWLHAGNANVDVIWDDDDRSYILVDDARVYYLTRNTRRRAQELELLPDGPGVGVWGFEFSDYCQTDFPHR